MTYLTTTTHRSTLRERRMFRLIQLHCEHGIPRIGVDPDGFASERAALDG